MDDIKEILAEKNNCNASDIEIYDNLKIVLKDCFGLEFEVDNDSFLFQIDTEL